MDEFTITAAAGDRLNIQADSPGGGPLPSGRLELSLQLVAPSGSVVATGDSGGEGLRAGIEYPVTEAGVYTIRVLPRDFAQGAYQLRVAGTTDSPIVRLDPLAPGSGAFHTRIDELVRGDEALDLVFGVDAGPIIHLVRHATDQASPALS